MPLIKGWQDLAPRLREVAKRERGTQKRLALKFDLREDEVTRILKGTQIPDPVIAHGLLKELLGLSLADVLGEPGVSPVRLEGEIEKAVDELVREAEQPREEVIAGLIREALERRGLVKPLPENVVPFPTAPSPIHGIVAAGPDRHPEWADEGETAEVSRHQEETARLYGWKLVRVFGDSMEPTLEDRDLIWVQPLKSFDNVPDREIVLFWFDGEPQVKRLRKQKPDIVQKRVFLPDNGIYPPVVPLSGSDLVVLGVMKEKAQQRRR